MFLGQNATFEFWILESFLRTKNLAEYLKIFTKKRIFVMLYLNVSEM